MGAPESPRISFEQAEARDRVAAAVREVLGGWGYRPARFDVLTAPENLQAGGERFRRRIVSFPTPRGRGATLRPKLSLAALIYFKDHLRGEPRPVRLATQGPVFQLDEADEEIRETEVSGGVVIGTASPVGFAEVLALTRDVLDALGLADVELRLSHRGVVDRVLDRLNFDPRLRQLVDDRLAAIAKGGPDAALRDLLGRADLERPEAPGDFEQVAQKMSAEELAVLLRGFLESLDLPIAKGRDYADVVGRILRRATLKTQAPTIQRAVEDLRALLGVRGVLGDVVRDVRSIAGDAVAAEMAELATMCEIATRDLRFSGVVADLGLATDAGFYDGLHFRLQAPDGRVLGHGGAMAGLLEATGLAEPTPSVGFAFDVDRIASLLAPAPPAVPRALLVPVAAGDLPAVLELARALRARRVDVELDVMGRSIKQGIHYAVRRAIPFLVIVGERERLAGAASVKNLAAETQADVALDDPDALAALVTEGARP